MEDSLVKKHLSSLSKPIGNRTAVICLQKSIVRDCSLNKILTQDSFVPFVKERDGMNKIITSLSAKQLTRPKNPSFCSTAQLTPKHRLISKVFFN